LVVPQNYTAQDVQNVNNKGHKTSAGLIIALIIVVVVIVIGVMSTLAIVALNSARIKSRDAKRISDIKQIQVGLELYYNDAKQYPSSIVPGKSMSFGGVTYMPTIPNNPIPNNGDCPEDFEYQYTVKNNEQSYELTYCLEGETGGQGKGYNKARPLD